jgi:hypothetical protein
MGPWASEHSFNRNVSGGWVSLFADLSFSRTPGVTACITVDGRGTTLQNESIRRSWWYGMVWYGLVWYGMVWYGMVRYGMVWYGTVWYGMVWYGMVRYGMVWYGTVWYGMVWYGMVWYGMVWYGMVWYGMVWYGTVEMLPVLRLDQHNKPHSVNESELNIISVRTCKMIQ